jgi:endonuclease/exonuclease/phosphatase family metal-dependent hydrolase
MWLRSRSAVGARLAAIVLLTAGVILAPAGVAQANGGSDLDVMTQNLYLGSSLDPALQARTQEEFFVAVATIYGTVQFTNFPARSDAIADEIAAEQPDLVGLQEVTKWTSTGPGAPPSLDFLAILQQDLADRGLSYSAASTSDNANVGPVPLVLCSGPFGSCTLTFQDRDVILVNNSTPRLTTSNPLSGRYQAQQPVPTPVGTLSFDRGWATVDGRFRGAKFHFANTHLEVEDFPAVQEAQGQAFLAGPGKGSNVIATGDFNSAADGSQTATYGNLTKFYRDAWRVNKRDPGFTCCQNSTLTNPTSALATRIDLVLTHGDVRTVAAKRVGATPFQATPPFWPSDHAGVVAALRL